MKLFVCSIFDRGVQSFGQPLFVPHTNAAVRSFIDEVNRPAPDNNLYNHSDDFDLYLIAEYDDSTGVFSVNSPSILIRAKDGRKD